MVFSSPVFLYFFLPLAVLGYFFAPRRGRNLWLIAASLFFYAWGEGALVALLAASAAANHWIALRIGHAAPGSSARRWSLALGVAVNLAALFYFKYWVFALQVVLGVSPEMAAASGPELPLGVSFFTFQGIAYLVDVYRGSVAAQGRLDRTALYIVLFPQLIAGPIVRYAQVARQLASRRFSIEHVAAGVELFIVGLAKKLLLADSLGRLADLVFASPGGTLPVWLAWLGAVSYALQIYFDFSGYTDMARGLGRVFGFELPENFRLPYRSMNLRDFWRRWHITLSSWFRDYVYIPLGGSRVSPLRRAFNLWAVFLLCGLWHGASWNFVLWGVVHGLWLTLEKWWKVEYWPRAMAWAGTALFLVFSWVLFRSEDLGAAARYWGSMLGMGNASGANADALSLLDGRFWLTLTTALALAGGLNVAALKRCGALRFWQARGTLAYSVRGLGFMALLVLCMVEVAASRYEPFIYFRF